MGFFDNVKKGAKSFADDYKKKSADNKAYKQEVSEAVKKARREAFKKEAIKQASLRAKIQAKQKFNPSQASGGGMSAEARNIIYGGFGSPTPAKKKKKNTKDAVKDILNRLPQ